VNSKRWVEALSRTAHGKSSKQVAADMGISIDAVTKHLQKAREKLSARTTTEAVYKAVKSGLICLLLSASVNNSLHDLTRIVRQNASTRIQRTVKCSLKEAQI
jgi:DNA-binding CsgD family transcriptional regulator